MEIFGETSKDRAHDFVYDIDGLMRYQSWVYVLDMDGLRNEILEKAHVAAYVICLEVTKMYYDLKSVY